jgi:hypothetical protein
MNELDIGKWFVRWAITTVLVIYMLVLKIIYEFTSPYYGFEILALRIIIVSISIPLSYVLYYVWFD